MTNDAGRDVLSKEVKPGDIIMIKFTHSVEKVEVVDTYTITEDGRLLARNSTFGAMGAGLPSTADYNVTIKDGLFIVENINKTFDRIHMITGSIPRHRVTIAGIEYSLLDLAGEEMPFIIGLERKSLADALISCV